MPALETSPATATSTAPRPTPAGAPMPFLIATDASAAALAALRVGRLLATGGREVAIVSVVEPIPTIAGSVEAPVADPEGDEARARELWERLRGQARDVFGETLPRMEVRIGAPIAQLARAARERGAAMVIAGLRHHGRAERMTLHRETPLSLARAARVPVLAVPESTTRLPRTVLLAVAGDEATDAAARAARPLLAEATRVVLAHVRGGWGAGDAAWDRFDARVTQAAFDGVAAALALPHTTHVERRWLAGDPVDALLELAETERAELIVTGYHRRLLIDRLLGPRSVAERVFRGADCAVLLVPEAAPGAPLGVRAMSEAFRGAADWPTQLAAFAYCNAGRPARLEIESHDIRKHAQVTGFPFVDVAHVGGAVRVLLGGPDAESPRLEHWTPRPLAIEVHRTAKAKDLALRVEYEGGYTLLTLE
jgi:nucleotide-binding universal stress UspA family protein